MHPAVRDLCTKSEQEQVEEEVREEYERGHLCVYLDLVLEHFRHRSLLHILGTRLVFAFGGALRIVFFSPSLMSCVQSRNIGICVDCGEQEIIFVFSMHGQAERGRREVKMKKYAGFMTSESVLLR